MEGVIDLKIEDIKLSMVKYKIKDFKISCPGLKEPYIVESSFIQNIILEKDFDNFFFPFFHFQISIPAFVLRAMRKANQDVRVYLDFQKGKFQEVENAGDQKPSFSSYISGNYYLYFDDTSPDMNEREIEEHERTTEVNNKGMEWGDLNTIKVLLYREDYLFKSKTIINEIFTSTTLVDALTYTLNKAGLSGVLISPPSNYKSYKEFVLTPITAMEQMDRICNEFGLHANGSQIFFDFKCIYILDKNTKCDAFVPNEYKTTYLASLTQSGEETKNSRGCYSNGQEKYNFLNIAPDSIDIRSLAGLSDQVYGNNFAIIDTASGKVTNVNSGAAASKSSIGGATKYMITNKGDNTANAIKQQRKESSKVATLGFTFIDFDMLAPNKEFVLMLEDPRYSKYNGKYRLTKYTAIFDSEGEYYSPQVTAEFKA